MPSISWRGRGQEVRTDLIGGNTYAGVAAGNERGAKWSSDWRRGPQAPRPGPRRYEVAR
jgi:hypothetical protein